MKNFKEKATKSSNGITLIALVITIIVLLILAGISISMLSGDNGILKRAEDARDETIVGQEKEQLQIEVLGSYGKNGKLEIATVNSNIKNNISGVTTDDAVEFPLTVTYTATNNSYEVDEVGNVYTAIDYPLAIDVLKVNKTASIDSEKSPYVNYIDINGNIILCRVLYNDEDGVEIISNASIEKIKLASGDEAVSASDFIYSGSGTFNENTSRAAASYNRVIITLNEQAEKYIRNNGIVDRARCVGSIKGTTSNTSDEIEMYTYTGTSWTYMNDYNWNGILKKADTNYSTDYTQMMNLNLNNINTTYWLASRDAIEADNTSTSFSCRVIRDDGTLYVNHYYRFLYLKSNGETRSAYDVGSSPNNGLSHGFRAIFHLSHNVKIKGGDGTKENPYKLGI